MVKCWQCAALVTGSPACLEKDGAPVGSVVPKEGGIQWTESYCIGKGSEKADIVKKFIQYMLSPDGQVKSAQMAAYPGFAITKSGRAKLIEVDRKEAERTGQIDGMANDPISAGEGRSYPLPQYSGSANARRLERFLV